MSKYSTKSREFFKLPRRGISKLALFIAALAVSHLLFRGSPTPSDAVASGFSFEVTGKVQGVSFRRHTKEWAVDLGLIGWVRNEPSGSVVGEIAGGDAVGRERMKTFLRETGSPRSRIDSAAFEDLDARRMEGLLTAGSFRIRASN
uniref:Acylphosphatase n=1 Tax=Corethron hystrix TaxID=216773 RepID=A0A7S1BNH4_9STRA|mmetsp:Transcript_33482/g.77216  ORF Transcript_33482/g.77216 Transcript_33482/m.77216 type:complete len:146 (+) Transcript_33482:46-483(+)